MTNNYKISNDYKIMAPIEQKSYPISIADWEFIKNKIDKISDTPPIWYSIGFGLLGISITTLITALISDFSKPQSYVICWAACILTFILGLFAIIFGGQQRKYNRESKADVFDYMRIIENRYIKDTIGLVIISAKYGADDKYINVTQELSSKIQDNQLSLQVNNEIAGDPIVGKGKKLLIEYVKNGERHEKEVKENSILKI